MSVVRWLDWYGDGSLVVVDVGLACCALEFDAAAVGARSLAELPRDGAVAVVISGTVTDRLAPSVLAIVDAAERACGHRPVVVAFGACASSGGPYWDSYAVTKGVDQIVQVDRYVPGCPPPPEALREVIDEIARRVSA
jgi:NADH-quinone oxidoreductase subunit B